MLYTSFPDWADNSQRPDSLRVSTALEFYGSVMAEAFLLSAFLCPTFLLDSGTVVTSRGVLSLALLDFPGLGIDMETCLAAH